MEPRMALYRKITWHLIPFLFGCYILTYVDRANVGFAKLQMQTTLGMSDTVYGAGVACSSRLFPLGRSSQYDASPFRRGAGLGRS
jgi:hypothetical protein